MVPKKKKKFSSKAQHNFSKREAISKCKNDKPYKKKKKKGKVPGLPLLRRPAPAPYFHPLLKIFQIPPPPHWKRYLKFTFAPLNRMGGGEV